jgi:hypothetical protein
MPRAVLDAESRFWTHVEKTGNCWVWTGKIGNKGYGYYTTGQRHLLTHRYAYTITYGQIPSGKFVLHHCDNRACVRPDHLFLGTHRDNMDDMKRKGRQAHGARTHTAILTEEQAIALLHEYAAGNHNQRALAEKYGVNFRSVWNLLHGETWKHLDRTGIDIQDTFYTKSPNGQRKKKQRPSRAKIKVIEQVA